MMRIRVPAMAFGLIGLLLIAGAARAEEYKLKLDRPEKVGHTYSISATGDMKTSSTASVPGVPPRKQDQAYTVALDGTIKILEVDEKSSQPTKLTCTVSKCLKDGEEMYPAGTVITAENKAGKTQFSVDGNALDPINNLVLNTVITTQKPGEPPQMDMVFRADQARKVGDKWDIDSDAAAREFSKEGPPVKAQDVKGTGKLVEVKNIDGKQVMQFEGQMEVASFKGPTPEGLNVSSGNMSARFTGLLPVDPQELPVSTEQQMTAHFVAQGGPGGQVNVEIDMQRSAKTKYGPAKS